MNIWATWVAWLWLGIAWAPSPYGPDQIIVVPWPCEPTASPYDPCIPKKEAQMTAEQPVLPRGRAGVSKHGLLGRVRPEAKPAVCRTVTQAVNTGGSTPPPSTIEHVCETAERSSTQVKRFQKLTGYPNGRPGYVVDHIIPLACGGPDHPLNMMWQTVEEAKAKDRWELQCERYCPPYNVRVKEAK